MKCDGERIKAQCTVCRGRMHTSECSSRLKGRLNPKKDCCPARHKMLFDDGQTVGFDDPQLMWDVKMGTGKGEFGK